MAPVRRSTRNAPTKDSSPSSFPKGTKAKKATAPRTPDNKNREPPEVPQTPVKKRLVKITPADASSVSGLKRAADDLVDEESSSPGSTPTPTKRIKCKIQQAIEERQASPSSSRPRGGSKKSGVTRRMSVKAVERSSGKKTGATEASQDPTGDKATDTNVVMDDSEVVVKKERGAMLTTAPNGFVEPLFKSASKTAPRKLKTASSTEVFDISDDDVKPDIPPFTQRQPVILVLDSDDEDHKPGDDSADLSEFEKRNPDFFNENTKVEAVSKGKGKGKVIEPAEDEVEAEASEVEDENDELVNALVAAKVPDPFKELLDKSVAFEKEETAKSEDAMDREAAEKAAMKDKNYNEPSMETAAMNTNARAARHDVFVLRGENNNVFIPQACAYHELREYAIEGMVGLYEYVIPLPEKKAVLVGLRHGRGVPMKLSKIFGFLSKPEFHYIRTFVNFPGAFGVANPSRCNPWSSFFNWKTVGGADILHVGDLPVLCYMVGFAKSSSILEPATVGNSGYQVKDVTMHPFTHEWERTIAMLCIVADVDMIHTRCWGDGVKIQTRQRTGLGPTPGPSSAPSSDPPASSSPPRRVGRFGVIQGETYSSPVTAVNKYSSAKLVKEPTDHIPIYDLTDGHFDPKHDFLNVESTRPEVPGIEVPVTEPVLMTYYVSKWKKVGMTEMNVDLNLQWVGLLSTDVPP